jgi:hypothetical protein
LFARYMTAGVGFGVGRAPWTATDALVGLVKSGSRGTRAHQGVRPTIASAIVFREKI